MPESDPRPGAYRPFVAAHAPVFRVLVHRQYLDTWNALAERVGLTSATQFWNHVSVTAGAHPSVGSSVVLKGKHNRAKWSGYSPTIHYEISGAGRIDYQFAPATAEGADGDVHAVVKILT